MIVQGARTFFGDNFGFNTCLFDLSTDAHISKFRACTLWELEMHDFVTQYISEMSICLAHFCDCWWSLLWPHLKVSAFEASILFDSYLFSSVRVLYVSITLKKSFHNFAPYILRLQLVLQRRAEFQARHIGYNTHAMCSANINNSWVYLCLTWWVIDFWKKFPKFCPLLYFSCKEVRRRR